MIEQVLLGSTGLKVSRVGLGTVKFGRNQGVKYPTPFNLPTDKEIEHLLDCAQELGINLLDTAPAYGLSEERLGKLLKSNRDKWLICTKVGEDFVDGQSRFDFSASAVRLSIERSLKKLKTDVLDIVLIHSNGEDCKIIEENALFTLLEELKKSGLIRAFGMSTKTVAGGLLAVEQSDVVMVTYNASQAEEKSVIDFAQEKKKGILIKKALASGHFSQFKNVDSIADAMEFVFNIPGVSSVILGTLNEKHLRHNVRCVANVLQSK